MHILVTNDDGVTAPGLLALAQEMRALGAEVLADTASPITGGKTAKRAGSPGNMEWLMLLKPIAGA